MATAPERIATTSSIDDLRDFENDNNTGAVSGDIIPPAGDGPDGQNPSENSGPAPLAIPDELNSGRPLEVLESVIEDSIHAQVAAGIALLEIQARKLYADIGHDSFTGYLQARWGYLSAGYKLMDAAKVQLALTDGNKNPDAPLPKNEAQAREIAPLVRKNPDAARAVWGTLTENSDPNTLTAADIREAVQAKMAELRPTRTTPARQPQGEGDGPKVGADKSVRFASFYGDPTIIGSHVAAGAASVIVYRVNNQRQLASRVSDLAETAASRLKKGGSVLFFASPALLPDIMSGVGDLLNYKWTLVSALDIGKSDNEAKPTLYNGYDAVVWYTKGKYAGEIVNDIIDLDGDGFKGLLEVMTKPDDLIATSALVQADMSDALYLLNAKRRLVVTSDNKSFLPVLDTNMREAGFLPADSDSDAGDDGDGTESEDDADPSDADIEAAAGDGSDSE